MYGNKIHFSLVFVHFDFHPYRFKIFYLKNQYNTSLIQSKSLEYVQENSSKLKYPATKDTFDKVIDEVDEIENKYPKSKSFLEDLEKKSKQAKEFRHEQSNVNTTQFVTPNTEEAPSPTEVSLPEETQISPPGDDKQSVTTESSTKHLEKEDKDVQNVNITISTSTTANPTTTLEFELADEALEEEHFSTIDNPKLPTPIEMEEIPDGHLDTHSKNQSYPFCDELFERQILKNSSFPKRAAIPSQDWLDSHEITQDYLNNMADEHGILKGGCWTPKSYCQVRESMAYIVPYRDRKSNFGKLLHHMHSFLQLQHREYCVILVNQADKGMFNRAKLMNVGYDFAKNEHYFWNDKNKSSTTSDFTSPTCLFFGDVDLLPESLRNLHGCFGYRSVHNCDKINAFNYRVRHIAGNTVSSGGVMSLSSWQYESINGHPNRYFAWGREDWDMAFRMRSYNSSDDETVPENRQRHTDFMNEYITNVTEYMSGGPKHWSGLVRADGYGYYYALPHKRSFQSAKKINSFLEDTPFVKSISTARSTSSMMYFRKVEGLNSLFYETERVDYNKSLTFLTVDIRPFIPKEFVMFVDNRPVYMNEIGKQIDSGCEFITFENVSISDQVKETEWLVNYKNITTQDDENKRIKICQQGNKIGDQCNALTNLEYLQIPFPLISKKVVQVEKIGTKSIRSPKVTIRDCPDNFGIFQTVKPDLVVYERNVTKNIKFEYISKYLQLPKIFLVSYRVWYEGSLIRDCFQYLKNGQDENKFEEENNDISIKYQLDQKEETIKFIRSDTFKNFTPGMYFVHEVIQDTGAQPLIDKYTIFKVKGNDNDDINDTTFKDIYYPRGGTDDRVFEIKPEIVTDQVINRPKCVSKKKVNLPADHVRMEFKNYVEQYLKSERGERNVINIENRTKMMAGLSGIANF